MFTFQQVLEMAYIVKTKVKDPITVYTIGHSNSSIEDFVEQLHSFGITRLIDIRSFPSSKKNPQFNQKALEKKVLSEGIEYSHVVELGGKRKLQDSGFHNGWTCQSFRSYAEHTDSEEFRKGMEKLYPLIEYDIPAIMCAEAVPWSCHRRIVSDVLVLEGFPVEEIIGESAKPHIVTDFALLQGSHLTYPSLYA